MDFVVLNKWHRYLGFAAAVFVVLLAVTGIMLNHSTGLGFGKQPLPAWLANAVYGVDIKTNAPLNAGELQIRKLPNERIEVSGPAGETFTQSCQGKLLGAVALPGQWIAGCASTLVFLSVDGELIEAIDQSHGLPALMDGLGTFQSQLAISAGNRQWLLNNETLEIKPLQSGQENIIWQAITSADDSLSSELTVERFLFDLHSGRAFGGWGVWLMDLVALVLILLVISGYVAWREKQKMFADN